MRSTSSNIYNLTGGRAQLRDIFVRLPASWSACAAAGGSQPHADPSPTDLLVNPSSSGSDSDNPWTLQFDGCGRPGLNIEMPVNFANNNNGSDSLASRAARLTKEWVKLKFGVFEETGFAGDRLYPAVLPEGTDNITNAGCTNATEVC